MSYKVSRLKDGTVEVYGTPKKDIRGIDIGKDLLLLAGHIWGTNSTRIVNYENVLPFMNKSIVVKFTSKDTIANQRRAKLLVCVWKYAYKNVPFTEAFFPKRTRKVINEDYESITRTALTVYKKYHETNLKKSKLGINMISKALNQKPSTKIISTKKDTIEKIINKLLNEDIGVINKINYILNSSLCISLTGVQAYGMNHASIVGFEKANKAIRKIIKKEFLKRYKITK